MGADTMPDPVQRVLLSQPKFVRELLAGGVAGGLAKTCVAPLERCKIMMQVCTRSKPRTSTRRLPNLGVAGVLSHIWQSEGVVGLFRGNSASVLRIVPYAAIHFSAYEHYRRMLVEHILEPGQEPGAVLRVHPLWDLVAGSAAGASAVLLTYPLDLVRTRMAFQADGLPPSQTPMATSSRAAALPAAQPGATTAAGVRTLTTSTAAATSSSVRHTLSPVRPGCPSHSQTCSSQAHISQTYNSNHRCTQLKAGRLLGHQSLHSRVSSGPVRVPHPGIRQLLMQIAREEGVMGLYRGVMPTLYGILPYAGLKFYVYQSLKGWYKARAEADSASTPANVLAAPSRHPSAPGQAAGRHLDADTAAAGTDQVLLAGTAAAASELLSDRDSGSEGGSASTSRAGSSKVQQQPFSRPQEQAAKLPLLVMLGFGGVSGLVAQTVTYPLDVIRRRMQVCVDGSCGPDATTWSTTRAILAQEGSWGLVRGLSINYLKVVPSTAIGFMVYDKLKEYLDVRGNL